MRWLFDVTAIVACICWEQWQRQTGGPGLRLVRGSPAPVRGQRWRRVDGVITMLVARPEMEARLRSALGSRAVVRTTRTWAELEQLTSGTRPLAVFVDPLADIPGDPVEHLVRLCRNRQLPLILYSALSPDSAARLIQFGQLGIRHVVFSRIDDNAERLNEIVDSLGPPRSPPPPPPRLVA